MKLFLKLSLFFLGVIVPVFCPAGTGQIVHVGAFNRACLVQKLPVGWEELFFEGIEAHTDYKLVMDDNRIVVQAVSQASSSGLITSYTSGLEKLPIIEWSWKVSNVYKKGDLKTKEGDDYPARIYVTFAYDPEKASLFDRAKFNLAKVLYGKYPPAAAINYIWANKASPGTMVKNPYTDKTMMFVVESGAAKSNQWISYSRNIVEDYKKAFGGNIPPISGIGIMTDSDNTKESATAWYGDIILRSQDPP